ncbi:hypothetical protein Pan216_16730 [Planctomycetes bacterium Pan216]|uniref:Glycosyltransferase RgtA/B/C/D-like domain-containing protein n=1 Tax=Kolteria novifilia TaxID=2527975 RepID=A0A518B1G4_9BACT|nr:hypothetical protein Pan216_16730 [Planctomycetes bacterium Pan216]
MSSTWRRRSILAAIVVVGVVDRWPVVATEQTHLDEEYSIRQHDTGSLRVMLSEWYGHPFINVIGYASSRLFWPIAGEYALWAARFPNFLAGLLTILVVFRLIHRRVGPEAALFGALMIAILPQHVLWSGSMRGYAPLMLFAVLASDYLFVATESGRARDWVGYSAAATCEIWTHPVSGVLLIGHFVYLGIVSLWNRNRRLFAGGLIAFSVAGILGVAFWVTPLFLIDNQLAQWIRGDGSPRMEDFFFNTLYWAVRKNLSPPLCWHAESSYFVALVAICVLGSLRGAIRDRLYQMVVVLSVVSWLVLEINPPGLFDPRYVLFLLPLHVVFVAVCLGYLPIFRGEYRCSRLGDVLFGTLGAVAAVQLLAMGLVPWSGGEGPSHAVASWLIRGIPWSAIAGIFLACWWPVSSRRIGMMTVPLGLALLMTLLMALDKLATTDTVYAGIGLLIVAELIHSRDLWPSVLKRRCVL